MQRRTLLKLMFASGILQMSAQAQAAQVIDVYKTPTCGCCQDWVTHLEQNGFTVKTHDVKDTAPFRARFGVPKELASCHTGFIEGYAIEGHVPASEIKRLLAERPKARGLSVPGMPVGTPGMEVEGTRRDAHDVILFAEDGSRKVFRHYPAQS